MHKANDHQETPKPDDGNGAPYDLKNKDGHYKQGTHSINSQWGPGPSQNDYPALVSSQYEPVVQSTEQASKSTIVSPIPFPYPNTDYSIQGSGNGGEDETSPEDSVIESDKTQPGNYGSADPSDYYSGVRGGPPHMSSPSRSTSYLKQPVFMLIPLNLEEASGSVNGGDEKIPPEDGIVESNQIQLGHYGPAEHLTQHVHIHDNEKPFVCTHCERTFRQRETLNQHLRIHSSEKSYGCGYCGEMFRNKAILKKHILTQQDVVHDICGKASKSLPDVIQHGRSAGMPLYVLCPISNKELKQKSTLRQHGCVHMESRPYPCVECGKRFRQQSHLTQHIRIHSNEKPFKCIYCGWNFRQQAILNQHLRIHTGEKPYKCSQCGKDFRQKAILDQHTRTN